MCLNSHFSLLATLVRMCSQCLLRSTLFQLEDPSVRVMFYCCTHNAFSFLATRERLHGSIPHLNVLRHALARITTHLDSACRMDAHACTMKDDGFHFVLLLRKRDCKYERSIEYPISSRTHPRNYALSAYLRVAFCVNMHTTLRNSA